MIYETENEHGRSMQERFVICRVDGCKHPVSLLENTQDGSGLCLYHASCDPRGWHYMTRYLQNEDVRKIEQLIAVVNGMRRKKAEPDLQGMVAEFDGLIRQTNIARNWPDMSRLPATAWVYVVSMRLNTELCQYAVQQADGGKTRGDDKEHLMAMANRAMTALRNADKPTKRNTPRSVSEALAMLQGQIVKA